MNVVDLFCGSKSIGSVFAERGHDVITVDWDKKHNPDMCVNILDIDGNDILDFYGWESVDYIHMSPDCTTYSIAAISHHRNKDGSAKSAHADMADNVRYHLHMLLEELQPRFFTIENPRGMMRKMADMQKLANNHYFTTVTYCQYGDTRMKPTDIWHNIPTLQLKPPCKNGDSCHARAPRGSRTGTQGLEGSTERSKIPTMLCVDICRAVEDALNVTNNNQQ